MPEYPRRFWRALQAGVEVAVAASDSPRLLGVRDGFRSFFRSRLPLASGVLVVPQQDPGVGTELPLSDEDTISLVETRASDLYRRLGENYQFHVAAEGGLDLVEAKEGTRTFVRYWVAVFSDLGDAVGASSAVEIPRSLVSGLGSEEARHAFPGTRRGGGMLTALTGGAETPRRAVADATTNALYSLFYGTLEGRSTPPATHHRQRP